MKEVICIVCPRGCHLEVDEKNGYAVTGNGCPRGAAYGKAELQHPTRVLTSTVRLEGSALRRLPVKTDRAIPRDRMREAMAVLDRVTVHPPVAVGQVLIPDLLGTGANLVATREVSLAE